MIRSSLYYINFDNNIDKNIFDENKESMKAFRKNVLIKNMPFYINIGVKAFKYRIYKNIYTQSSEALNYSGLGEHT